MDDLVADNFWAWGGLALAILTMTFVAAAEVSMTFINRADVRRLIEEGVPRARAMQTMLDNPPRFVAALMVLKGAAFVGAGSIVTWLFLNASARPVVALPVGLLIVWGAMLSIQIAARAAAMRSLERVALRLGPLVKPIVLLLTPITNPLRLLGRLVLGGDSRTRPANLFLSEDGLRFLMNIGEEPGLIEEDEKEMIAGIFELSETVVREVMAPRIDVIAIEENATLQEALDVIIEAGHSRIPVYREHIDNIQGVLYAKDLLPPLRDGRYDVKIPELMRPAYFVPELKKIDDLLSELQERKVHLAIAVDEYGGIAGVVTIEDLVEEIVGEIQDEYDSELPMVIEVGEGEHLFDARISLDEASAILGVNLPDEDSDTLGGFILSQLGRVPVVGSQVHYHHITMEVRSVSGRRILQVKVSQAAVEESDESSQTDAKRPVTIFSSLF